MKTSGFTVRYNPTEAGAVIGYFLQGARRLSMNIFDQRGRRIAAILSGAVSAGRQEAVGDAKRAPAGIYIGKMVIDGRDGWSGKFIVSK
jgi:hypothetical protein